MKFWPVIQRDSLWIIRWHGLRYFLDLSYASICRELQRLISVPASAQKVLDIGAGLAPWRRYFRQCQYLTVDPHGCPEDFQRWTPRGLEQLLEQNGWQILELRARGGDWSLLASKWIFFWGRRLSSPLTCLPAAIVFLGSAPAVALLGHLSMLRGWGFSDEAMGWFVRAKVKA